MSEVPLYAVYTPCMIGRSAVAALAAPPLLPPFSANYGGTSFEITHTSLGPYHRPMPMVLGGSERGKRFLMSEVPHQSFIFSRWDALDSADVTRPNPSASCRAI